ncbi:hypothetical protein [Microcoleus vaginatus]
MKTRIPHSIGLCRITDGYFRLSTNAVIWIRDRQVEMLVQKLIVL